MFRLSDNWLGNTATLGRKQLSLKLVMLMALANASRCLELHALDIERMKFSEMEVIFSLTDLTKTSKPGKNKILFYPSLIIRHGTVPSSYTEGIPHDNEQGQKR